MSVDQILYLVAFVCLLLAGLNVPVRNLGLPWLAAAALVLTLLI